MAIECRNNRLKGAIGLTLESNVVAGVTNVFSPDDHLSRFGSGISLVAVEVLRLLMDFYGFESSIS
jgi:hypothetical protein